VPEGILESLKKAAAGDAARAVVLIGGERSFIFAADTREFAKITSMGKEPGVGLHPVPTARVGQPEVKLGILPGAAGMHRLLRLAGVVKAVGKCRFGGSVKAPAAASLDLIHRVIAGEAATNLPFDGGGAEEHINGYGFPAHRGGPMFHADTVGLDKVLARIREFHERHGALWTPEPLLGRLAREGEPFAEGGSRNA